MDRRIEETEEWRRQKRICRRIEEAEENRQKSGGGRGE